MTTQPPLDADLQQNYATLAAQFSGPDGRVALAPDALGDVEHDTGGASSEAAEAFDLRLRDWLGELPALVRYVVERHSGPWTDEPQPGDYDALAEELGLSPSFVRACYEEGVEQLRRARNRLG